MITTVRPAFGHQLPRRAMAGAAATPLTPDTKTDGRRDRFGPIASLRSAEKQWVFAPLDHLEVSDRLADQGVSF